MASPQVTIRFPAALLEKVDAEAARSERSRSDVVLDILAERLLGVVAEDAAPAPIRAKSKAPKAPVPADPRAALAQAEKAQGVEPADMGRGGRAMAAAGVMVFQGGKRPAYQKGQGKPGKGKVGR